MTSSVFLAFANATENQMTDKVRNALVLEKVSQLRKALEELGLDSSFFYRTPGSATAPVGYLLIGESADDLEAARADRGR